MGELLGYNLCLGIRGSQTFEWGQQCLAHLVPPMVRSTIHSRLHAR